MALDQLDTASDPLTLTVVRLDQTGAHAEGAITATALIERFPSTPVLRDTLERGRELPACNGRGGALCRFTNAGPSTVIAMR
jgi:hypothetical protein